MEYQFNIANVKFLISAPETLKVDEKWALFSADFSEPDYRFRIRFEDALEIPEGRQLLTTDRVCLTERDGKLIRSYRGSAQEPVGLIAEETAPGVCEIRTIRWGSWGEKLSNFMEAMALPHCLALKGRLMLHCAYLLHEGEGILFTARSGVGKSTQAGLWVKYRSGRMINGDRAVLSLEDGRLMVSGLPLSGSSPDCLNVTVPVRAIVGLAQGRENILKPLHPVETAKWLMNGTYLAPEFREDSGLMLELALRMAVCAQGWHLTCLPEQSAVDVLYQAIYSQK